MNIFDHPNIKIGDSVVPGAVNREYIEQMVKDHCTVVDNVFELPWQSGVFYVPDDVFLERVGLPQGES